MKKVTLAIAVLFIAATAFTSCRETEKETETIVREVEVETQDAAEESEGILERAGSAVDAEVNKEIDEEIDEIGDDN
ncbi:hypothetical protein [Nonlabens ponticola]|uniref:YtxH domain-containing protein n=1 Tax=Nonlabens ponticola TaxID=2496866 RepID=A0A3S9MUY3_9FLAO|nr:hypothetical protein [Nonlabens ponticola]AZQ42963.1 hypothetical protein EJ995_01445 [Nonlabens ponticola]